MVDAGNVDQSDFDAAKSKFVDIVNAGITQRKANQELADGNKAADGLATVSIPIFSTSPAREEYDRCGEPQRVMGWELELEPNAICCGRSPKLNPPNSRP